MGKNRVLTWFSWLDATDLSFLAFLLLLFFTTQMNILSVLYGVHKKFYAYTAATLLYHFSVDLSRFIGKN